MRKRMRRSFRGMALFGFCAPALMWSPSAGASPTPTCLPGTIASVMAQGPCTIGDATFNFYAYSSFDSGTFSSSDADTDVTFTPLTANPLDPGFELGPFSSTAGIFTTTEATVEDGVLAYTVASTSGRDDLDGFNVNLVNPTVGAVAIGATAGAYAAVAAANALRSGPVGPGTLLVNAYANQLQYTGPLESSSSSHGPSTTGPVTFAPIASSYAYAVFQSEAFDCNYYTGVCGGYGTAEAMSWADYTFAERTNVGATPEPGTLVLLGSGLILILGILRRKIIPTV